MTKEATFKYPLKNRIISHLKQFTRMTTNKNYVKESLLKHAKKFYMIKEIENMSPKEYNKAAKKQIYKECYIKSTLPVKTLCSIISEFPKEDVELYNGIEEMLTPLIDNHLMIIEQRGFGNIDQEFDDKITNAFRYLDEDQLYHIKESLKRFFSVEEDKDFNKRLTKMKKDKWIVFNIVEPIRPTALYRVITPKYTQKNNLYEAIEVDSGCQFNVLTKKDDKLKVGSEVELKGFAKMDLNKGNIYLNVKTIS